MTARTTRTAPATLERHDHLRLFCALRLPDPALDELLAWQERVLAGAPGVRQLGREHLHVTLAFLGRRPADDLPVVGAALREAVAGIVAPVLVPRRYRETRSVGMVVCDDVGGRATRMAARLQRRLERAKIYRPEARPWLPHITVARFRERPHLRPEVPSDTPFSPSEAAVYHSLLRPSGAQYDVLELVALGG